MSKKTIATYLQRHHNSSVFISSAERDRDLLNELYGEKPVPFISSSKRDLKLLEQLYGKSKHHINENDAELIAKDDWKIATLEQLKHHGDLSTHYFEKVHPHTSKEERTDLYHYGSGSSDINSHLLGRKRYNISGSAIDPEFYKKKIENTTHRPALDLIGNIDKTISKSKLPYDIKTFSGLGFDPRNHGLLKPGNKMHLKAYTSTTIKPSTAATFADGKFVDGNIERHHMVFHLKKGQPGLYMSSELHPLGGGTGEREVLLPRNIHVKLLKHEIHQPRENETYHAYHVEVEPHENN